MFLLFSAYTPSPVILHLWVIIEVLQCLVTCNINIHTQHHTRQDNTYKNMHDYTVKPVLNDPIKQDIFLAFQSGGCLLLHESSAESSYSNKQPPGCLKQV